jgi:predicted oxidoreductase
MSAERIDTDVAIIGGGVAGALEAPAAGARVVLLEQDAALGGTAASSGGGCFIVGTPLQEAQGIHDTPDAAVED